MDMAQLSNTLLQIFYIMIGLYMGLTMVFTIRSYHFANRYSKGGSLMLLCS